MGPLQSAAKVLSQFLLGGFNNHRFSFSGHAHDPGDRVFRHDAPGLVLERGIGFEMTDLERDGKRYCSIAFEAFPDDAATAAGFDAVIAASLEELPVTLGIEASLSYPEWLHR